MTETAAQQLAGADPARDAKCSRAWYFGNRLFHCKIKLGPLSSRLLGSNPNTTQTIFSKVKGWKENSTFEKVGADGLESPTSRL